ncbi:hypothetical protein NPX13_g5141 [Xylaria arbuscula]|uniref:Protein NO VEIN C-terminal domain-containing protein n=1 Tax=Xylaria arbuscula TaxID=114810 RepID=A0A9W8NEP5_9PEZI|nr:hypothetical protein NPX13_g5141 [Xylaria arbuscula]
MAALVAAPYFISAAEARRLVDEIKEDKGFLTEEDLDKIGPPDSEIRRKVENAMVRKDTMIGESVLTLAKNLYTSSARFVFELLQNADDNNFSRAAARSEDPYVSFQIFPDRVILECNEDGFTPENLRAICAIGASSKVGAQAYIGEKGIGFKSVFKAAWRVHIQSNAFSFTFTHRIGDPGIGMISPVWCEPHEIPGNSFTRITLFLHQYSNPVMQNQRYNEILNQFNELQGTLLLFLRKIRKVKITFYNEAGILTSEIQHSLRKGERVSIRKTSRIGTGPEIIEKKWYYVFRETMYNVPESENRSYANGQRRADVEAEVILAFPVTEDSIPIVEDQDVFAFLPLRPMGFKFLMHTDFVTEASRQSIVTNSQRNQFLRIGITKCFITAIQQFCRHSTLQFQWMRWLPRRGAYPWDFFWNGLLDQIDRLIVLSNILRCDTDGRLERIGSLRTLSSNYLTQTGEPLFGDLNPAIYVSLKYHERDLALLRPYGLRSLSLGDLIHLLSYDLKKTGNSCRFRSKVQNEEWHSRVSRLITSCVRNGTALERQEIRSMRIVSLTTGEWMSALEGTLYYPHCEGAVLIPSGLKLNLVDQAATTNRDRRELFDVLGVSTAPVGVVQNEIFSRSITEGRPMPIPLEMSVSYLVFLYLTHVEDSSHTVPGRFSAYPIYDQLMKLKSPHYLLLYMRSSNEYEPSRLLDGGNYGGWFINNAYFENHPPTPPGKTLSWGDWICQYLRVRRCLRLTDRNRRQLSVEFQYVINKHPEKVVGTLRRSWAIETAVISDNQVLIDKIRSLKVPSEDGKKFPLGCMYLPLPELKASFSRYAEDETFPFIRLPEPVTLGTYHEKWGFLVDVFGVRYSEDFRFYLRLLEVLSEGEDLGRCTIERARGFLDLYQRIHGSTQTSNDRLEAWSIVRQQSINNKLVYIPSVRHENLILREMVSPKNCVWAGDINMSTVHPLESIYHSRLNLSSDELDSLKPYFKTVLQVPDCNWKHYIEELRQLKRHDAIDFDWVNTLYSSIGRRPFETEALIYVPNNTATCWYNVSQCIWSTATQIQGRAPVNELYPDLERFLTDFLGVARLTLQMAYDELKLKGNSEPAPAVQEVKDAIFAFNSLLQSASASPNALDPDVLFESRIFPTRHPHGPIELKAATTDFAIVDRELYYKVFAPQVKLLDFTLEEIRRLEPFISWLGIDDRYLSVVVKEISTVEVTGQRSRPLQSPRRSLAGKARSLVRVATHYNSPRVESPLGVSELLRTLSTTRVYETDRITSELHLSQDGRDFKFIKDTSELHIREDRGGVLEIYVPRDKDRQELCYLASLPPRLLNWLMMEPASYINPPNSYIGALDVVNSILNAPARSVGWILTNRGIVDVKFGEDADNTGHDHDNNPDSESVTLDGRESENPEHDELDESEESRELENLREAEGRREGEPRGGEPEQRRIESGIINARQAVISMISAASQRVYSNPQRSQERIHDPDPEQVIAATIQNTNAIQGNYLRLLQHVISRARTATFPHQGPFDMSGLVNALPADEEVDDVDGEMGRRFHSRVPLERDMKIGAAGELFVFEMLSHLNPALPNFTRTNWRSTIRKFVTAHPDYADMAPWTGRETADIVYPDASGNFTSLLLDSGYFNRDNNAGAWRAARPTYLIEVKTSTQSANAPFFMSRRQFQRMREYTNPAAALSNSQHATIYVIFRVFNVDKDSIGGRVYLDPEQLRRDGALVFTEQD